MSITNDTLTTYNYSQYDRMSVTVDNIDFSDWLQREMNKRDWSQAELARRAGVSRQVINTYINRQRVKPDEDILAAIAHALQFPPEYVFRAAGILHSLVNSKEMAAEVLGHKLDGLSASQIEELIKYIDFMKDRDGHQGKHEIIQRRIKKTREGSTPPEVVKRI